MFATFRLSMTWLHTWFGLVLGFVLMVCSCLARCRYSIARSIAGRFPKRVMAPQPMPSFDKMLLPNFRSIAAGRGHLRAGASRASERFRRASCRSGGF